MSIPSIFAPIFFNCWFIVASTQYRRYLDLPSLMVGTFYKPPSIRRDKAHYTHTGAAQDWNRASIGFQRVDIDW